MEETILDGAMQYGMNTVTGKFYMPKISNKQRGRQGWEINFGYLLYNSLDGR
jgi:hypothetical protein